MSTDSSVIVAQPSNPEIFGNAIGGLAHDTSNRSCEFGEECASQPDGESLPDNGTLSERSCRKEDTCHVPRTQTRQVPVQESKKAILASVVVKSLRIFGQFVVGVIFFPIICLAWFSVWITYQPEAGELPENDASKKILSSYSILKKNHAGPDRVVPPQIGTL